MALELDKVTYVVSADKKTVCKSVIVDRREFAYTAEQIDQEIAALTAKLAEFQAMKAALAAASEVP